MSEAPPAMDFDAAVAAVRTYVAREEERRTQATSTRRALDVVRIRDTPLSLRERILSDGDRAITRVDLLALATSIEADLAAASAHRALALEFVGRIETAGAATVVAASLHHYYGAIEALVERVMRGFGHSLPSVARWHVELLEGFVVEGVRPALFGPTSGAALSELLAFRHFFRHAYAVGWDPVRLTQNCHVMSSAAEAIDADITRFVATLRAAAE